MINNNVMVDCNINNNSINNNSINNNSINNNSINNNSININSINSNSISNVEDLTNNFNNLNMSNCNDILNINDISSQIHNEKDLEAFLEHLKNNSSPFNMNNIHLNKELLEIRNRETTKHFDDEDFIYTRFELPVRIIEEIAHSGLDFTDYFEHLLNNFEDNSNFDNYEVYYNMCIVFQYISNYYCFRKEEKEKNKNIMKENYFPFDFIPMVKTICHDVSCDCCLDSNNAGYTYFHDYTKEVMHGLRLIVVQLSAIIKIFESNNFNNLNLYPDNYKNRVIKLINNMCIIMLFMKFYYNQPDYNFDTTEKEDQKMDYGNLIPKEWQIQYNSKKVKNTKKEIFNKFSSIRVNNDMNVNNDINNIETKIDNININDVKMEMN